MIDRIRKIGIVPVIAIHDANKAVPLVRALAAGGIPCAEITFRTAAGEEALRRISTEAPDILLAAGTVLTIDQANRAKAAGATFAVSPGFNPKVVAHCQDIGLPIIPGCATPSDMEAALEMGLEIVKFFPAEQAGGLPYIKACAAPYGGLQFLPTGGITEKNLAEYLAFPKVVACGGSFMATPALIDAGNFDEITRLSQLAVEIRNCI